MSLAFIGKCAVIALLICVGLYALYFFSFAIIGIILTKRDYKLSCERAIKYANDHNKDVKVITNQDYFEYIMNLSNTESTNEESINEDGESNLISHTKVSHTKDGLYVDGAKFYQVENGTATVICDLKDFTCIIMNGDVVMFRSYMDYFDTKVYLSKMAEIIICRNALKETYQEIADKLNDDFNKLVK